MINNIYLNPKNYLKIFFVLFGYILSKIFKKLVIGYLSTKKKQKF